MKPIRTAEDFHERLRSVDHLKRTWWGRLLRRNSLRIRKAITSRYFSDNPLSRFLSKRIFYPVLASVVVDGHLFGTRKGGDAAEVALNYVLWEYFFDTEIDVGEVGPKKTEVFHLSCPFFFHENPNRRLCETFTNLDRAIVKRLGGKYTEIDTIAKGAPRCHRIIEVE